LDRNTPIACIDFAWADQDVVELLVELEVTQDHFAAQSDALVGHCSGDDARGFDLTAETVDLALDFAHAPLGFVVWRIFAEIAILICGGQIFANGRRDLRFQVLQLRPQLIEAFLSQLDDGGFFATSLRAAALSAHAQAGTEIDLGHFLSFEIVQERFERFDARRRISDGIGQIILIALDFKLGNLRDRPFGPDMSDETVDFARGELTLTGSKVAEISGGNLAEAFCVDFLYGNTSSWQPSQQPGFS
jgi:hypothetical protein